MPCSIVISSFCHDHSTSLKHLRTLMRGGTRAGLPRYTIVSGVEVRPSHADKRQLACQYLLVTKIPSSYDIDDTECWQVIPRADPVAGRLGGRRPVASLLVGVHDTLADTAQQGQ